MAWLPTARKKIRRRTPVVVEEFNVQVLLWNPQQFPQHPEQWTEGLQVTMWSDGSVEGLPYGTGNGMHIDMEVFTDTDGRRYVRFPFTINGFP